MRKLEKIVRGILLCISAGMIMSILTNCSGLLTAKFEEDSIGSNPDKTLPGNPTGDELTYVNEVSNQLEIIATPGYPSQKTLEYKSVNPSGSVSSGTAWISFKAKSTNFGNPITFTWTAQKEFSNSGYDMYIDITDGSGILATRMKILKNGDLLIVTNLGMETGNVIGNIPNSEKHSFLVTVNLESSTYSLSVLKSSGNIVENNLSILSNITSFHNPARPTVSFKYKNYGVSQEYLIDEVFISRKN